MRRLALIALLFTACASLKPNERDLKVEFLPAPPENQREPVACAPVFKGPEIVGLKCQPLIPLLMELAGPKPGQNTL